jgi:hypothetical protein
VEIEVNELDRVEIGEVRCSMNRSIGVIILAVAAAVSVVITASWCVSTTALTDTRSSGQTGIKDVQTSGIPPQLSALLNRPLTSPVESNPDSGRPFPTCYNGWVQGNDVPLYQCELRNLPSCI